MKIIVIDGQGGKMGKGVVEQLKKAPTASPPPPC